MLKKWFKCFITAVITAQQARADKVIQEGRLFVF